MQPEKPDARAQIVTGIVAAERERLLTVARGCLDYLGGYTDGLDIFRHGIQTVINALELACSDPSDSQVNALISVGADGICARCSRRTGRGE
jgi:hypothetical protein